MHTLLTHFRICHFDLAPPNVLAVDLDDRSDQSPLHIALDNSFYQRALSMSLGIRQ